MAHMEKYETDDVISKDICHEASSKTGWCTIKKIDACMQESFHFH